jgi:hypothetical protein
MTGISETILRAELAALHEQILIVHEAHRMSAIEGVIEPVDFHEALENLFGMLPDGIRPDEVARYSLYRDPTKPTPRKADDML